MLVGMLGCEVVGEAARGEEALALLETHKPNMLVLDLSLAGRLNGRDVLVEIRRRYLPVKVFVHTAFLNRDDFEKWVDDPNGPDGIDEKSTGDKELAIGFTQVLVTSEKYVPLRLIKKFGTRLQGEPSDRLTFKETQVLKLALHPEFSTQEIAKQMRCTASTVRWYLTTIYAKLGLERHTRASLMVFHYDRRNETVPLAVEEVEANRL